MIFKFQHLTPNHIDSTLSPKNSVTQQNPLTIYLSSLSFLSLWASITCNRRETGIRSGNKPDLLVGCYLWVC